MKEEICIDLEKWRRDRPKLSKNKRVESVKLGDMVMIRRTNKHEVPQFGLVTSMEDQGRNSGVQLRLGYRLFTSVPNLIPIGSGPVVTDSASGEVNSAQFSNMDLGQPNLGAEFSHFVSLTIGDDEEQTRSMEKFQDKLWEIQGIGRKKNLKKLHITLMTLKVNPEEREAVETSFKKVGDKFSEITGNGGYMLGLKGLEVGDG